MTFKILKRLPSSTCNDKKKIIIIIIITIIITTKIHEMEKVLQI